MAYKTVKDIICSMDRIARERGLKWMDSTMLLYALRWPESEADRSIGDDIPNQYREGWMDAFGWAATYCRLLAERK